MRPNIQHKQTAVLILVLSLLSVSMLSITAAYASAQPHSIVTGGDNAKLILTSPPQPITESPGQSFTLQFSATNTGTTTWGNGYNLKCLNGPICPNNPYMGINGQVQPGNTYPFIINLKVPVTATINPYTPTWSMVDGSQLFGNMVTATINVTTPAPIPTETSTPTPTPTVTSTTQPSITATTTLTPPTNSTTDPKPTMPSSPTSTSDIQLKATPNFVPVQIGQKITFQLTLTNTSRLPLTNTKYFLQCTPQKQDYCQGATNQPRTWKILPGKQLTFTITLTPITKPGTYKSIWMVENKQGKQLAKVPVTIEVAGKQPGGSIPSKGTKPPVAPTGGTFNLWLIAGTVCGLLALLLYLMPAGQSSTPLFNRVLALFVPDRLRQ